jgi:4-carboxymuconolactone decarboxylase
MSDESFNRGKSIANSVLGKTAAEKIGELEKIAPMHGRAIYEYCFGTVWAEPLLNLKIKEFILIAVCAAQGEYEAMERQVRGALNQGATRKEIIEAITTCAPYIGFPRTNAALRATQGVFDQWDKRPEWKAI